MSRHGIDHPGGAETPSVARSPCGAHGDRVMGSRRRGKTGLAAVTAAFRNVAGR
jgi:hypothetical protein